MEFVWENWSPLMDVSIALLAGGVGTWLLLKLARKGNR